MEQAAWALAHLTDATVLPSQPLITTITLAELSVGPLVAEDEREREARQAHLQQAEADSIRFRSTTPPRARSAASGASLRRAGRKTAVQAYDAMIAAIAIAHDLPLHTCNPADFTGIDDLRLAVVPSPPPVWPGARLRRIVPDAASSLSAARRSPGSGRWGREPAGCPR
jgi:tRNA(fMet)-specific endonuclease VapC